MADERRRPQRLERARDRPRRREERSSEDRHCIDELSVRYNPSFLASSVLRAALPRSPNHDNQPVPPAAREPSDLLL